MLVTVVKIELDNGSWTYKVLVGGVGRSRFSSIKEVGMIETLMQLHEDVLQAHLFLLCLPAPLT